MIPLPRIVKGRVFGRGLGTVLLAALCVTGVMQAAIGAIVPAKAVAAQILLERAFDRSLASHRAERPWPWADMAPVARLSVPRLGIDRIVLDTGSGQAMAFGPTLLPGGAALDEPGMAVIAAHRDTHFRFLRHVRRGDAIDVQGRDGAHRLYRVIGSEIVRADRFAAPDGGAARELALSTCYPFDAIRRGTLRYVVYAAAVDR